VPAFPPNSVKTGYSYKTGKRKFGQLKMKVADIWKISETFTVEMNVLRAAVKFKLKLKNMG